MPLWLVIPLGLLTLVGYLAAGGVLLALCLPRYVPDRLSDDSAVWCLVAWPIMLPVLWVACRREESRW